MNNPVVLAMDIGGTNIRFALVTADGNIIDRFQSPCRIGEGLNTFLAGVQASIEAMQKSAAASEQSIVTVSAGVPGLIDLGGTVISSVNLKPLNGLNLRSWLESSACLPSVILNDANAAAAAELNYGAGKPYRSFLHLTLGTGVGSGLVLDGKLWTGCDGVAAEYGHTTVEPEGQLCQCGNHGCLEQYASATAIARMAREKLRRGEKSILSGAPFDVFDASDVASAADQGDPLAIQCFNTAGRCLGIAVASAVNLLNLEAIIMGGGVAESFHLLEPVIRKEIELRAFSVPGSRVKVIKGELGDNAGILGAAAAGWNLASN
jgi:glucokinase